MSGGAPTELERRIAAGAASLPGKDGADYAVRFIRAEDAPSLIRGYDAMTERGKWFRMLHAVPHLTEEMATRFCAPDTASEICIVVEGRGDLAGEILGGARVAGLGPGLAAEFSVSLRPEARGLGLARQALETVIEIARQRGCATVWGSISGRNEAMLALARRVGFEVHRDPDDFSLMHAEMALTGG